MKRLDREDGAIFTAIGLFLLLTFGGTVLSEGWNGAVAIVLGSLIGALIVGGIIWLCVWISFKLWGLR